MKVLVLNNFAIGNNHLGKAVFAARSFKKGEVVTQFNGEKIHISKIPQSYEGERDRYMQIDREYFIGPSGSADDLINHSCDPNTGIKFTKAGLLLVAIRDIEAGEEITWDYSTTMFENPWRMRCQCQSPLCRKVIGDFMLLDPKLQQKYRELDIIPDYLKQYMDSDEYDVYTEGIRNLKEHERTKK